MAQIQSAKLIILGSGPAGLTAAIYAARAMLEPVVIEGIQPGGQMTITSDVENYPGFPEVIQGPWLMEQMRAQAAHVGTRFVSDIITSVDLARRPFTLVGDGGDRYEAQALIIATGAQARWLGLPSEKHFQGSGVSACATCDGFFYRGKRVIVVGGGNTALEESLFLTNFASKVVLVHRRDSFRGEKMLQQKVLSHPKIEVRWNSAVEEILGAENPRGVTGARIKRVDTGAREDIAIDGVFVAIGHDPATALFRGQINMDAENYIVTAPDSTATDISGVFAAGDVKDKIFRQAVTAAGMGCMAALEVEKFLAH